MVDDVGTIFSPLNEGEVHLSLSLDVVINNTFDVSDLKELKNIRHYTTFLHSSGQIRRYTHRLAGPAVIRGRDRHEEWIFMGFPVTIHEHVKLVEESIVIP